MLYDRERLLNNNAMRRQAITWLYFRRFLKHPSRLASVAPSSPALGRLVAQEVRRSGEEFVVELGCGTGAITGALLAAGVPAAKLVAVDLDTEMLAILRGSFPDVTVLEGDAFRIGRLLPAEAIGRVGTVICGLPISLLTLPRQRALTAEMLALMPPGRRFLAYTHRLSAPLPAAEVGITGARLAHTLRNLPPASVWGYQAADRC